MLLFSVIIYLAITVLVGVLAARMVKNEKDFILAGRRLPLYISAAALFATWFGSETVLGASSVMAKEGLYGVAEDPFGASLCLFLLGAFFARPLYRMNILTIGDFYRNRFGRFTEFIASICLVLSYLGWIAAQMVAMGIILNVVGGIDTKTGIIIGSLVVVGYTFLGGMWSVSITDFIQMILIIAGLAIALWQIMGKMPLQEVIDSTPKEHFELYRGKNPLDFINYVAAWITIGFGSIPQQDVFQRVMSARSEKVAVRASYLGGFMYLTIAFIPLVLALYAMKLNPHLLELDSQLMIPALIMGNTAIWVQILFFGALLSAVMSSASGALLAPSAILSENLIGNFIFNGDKKAKQNQLRISRISVLIIAVISIGMALWKNNIYELVGQSSALSLVSLFVPLVAGLYWKKANNPGAILSIFAGMIAWFIALFLETKINPLIYGLGASVVGMIVGVIFARKTE
jgi:solute:Na+ symporter, SSS family